jgi:hypothetical protein
MHLFIVHQFPDYDNFVPIIVNLKKKINSNFGIMNIFPVHDLKYYRFNELLKKYKIEFINVSELNIKSNLINFLLKFITIIPHTIIQKLNRVWYYFYHKYVLFNKKHVVALIKKYKIKSINIDHGLPFRYKQIFQAACKEAKIKYNCYLLGVELRNGVKFKAEEYSLYDHTIIQDQNYTIDGNEESKKKFIMLPSPRYSLDWINEVEDSYRYRLKEYNPDTSNRKLKVLIMTRPRFSEKTWQIIYEELKKVSNIELKIKFKPRGQFRPLHSQKNIINEYNSSELINWADIVVAHSSSILIETIIKNKKILFLNFLFQLEKKEKSNYIFENQNVVESINSIEGLIKRIQNLKINENQIIKDEKYEKSKNIFIEKIFGNNYFNKESIYKKEFINIYLN